LDFGPVRSVAHRRLWRQVIAWTLEVEGSTRFCRRLLHRSGFRRRSGMDSRHSPLPSVAHEVGNDGAVFVTRANCPRRRLMSARLVPARRTRPYRTAFAAENIQADE